MEGRILCPSKDWKKLVNEYQIKSLIGNKKVEEMQNKVTWKMMNIIVYINCHSSYEFIGKPRDAPSKDQNSKIMSQ